MTNILIINGHPDPSDQHLCHAIADTYGTAAIAQGHHVQIIHIAEHYIPYVRSKEDWESSDMPQVALDGQAAILAADHIVLVYPLWMGDVPAMFKAWMEQVMRHGFAFHMDDKGWTPALKGKTARVFVTMGMPSLAYRWYFFAHSVRSLKRNVLQFAGIKPVQWTIFGNAEDPNGKAQAASLKTAAELGRSAT